MSKFKSICKISAVECFRETSKYSRSRFYSEKLEKQHVWCNIFCKEFCIRDAVENCYKENTNFCKNNCRKYCFYIGPTPVKTQ